MSVQRGGSRGISLFDSFCDRPELHSLLGPQLGCPQHQITPVIARSRCTHSVTSFFIDSICRVILPIRYGSVECGGSGAAALLLNCDHHIKVSVIAEELEIRVRRIAEKHYRSLPTEKKKSERLTSDQQWKIVKHSLERLLVMDIFSHDSFEVTLVALRNVIVANQRLSCILIHSINSFYRQIRERTGIYHNPYVRKLLTHLVASSEGASRNLKILVNHLVLFDDDEKFYSFKNPKDPLVVIKDKIIIDRATNKAGFVVSYNGASIEKQYL